MTEQETEKQSSLPKLTKTPWAMAVLAMASVIGSLLLYQIFERTETDKTKLAYELEAQKIVANINLNLLTYEHALTAAVGLFNASDSVDADEWQRFFSSIEKNRRENSPLEALGYAAQQTGERVNGAAPTQAIVRFIQAPTESDISIGSNLLLDDRTRLNMLLARDEGIPKTVELGSAPISFEGAKLFVFFPLYRNDVSTSTLVEKQRAFQGWLFAQINFSLLLDIDEESGFAIEPETEGAQSAWSFPNEIEFIDRNWAVRLAASESRIAVQLAESRAGPIALALALFNLFIIAVLISCIRVNLSLKKRLVLGDVAMVEANTKFSKEIEAVQKQYQRIFSYLNFAPDSMIVVDAQGEIVYANLAAHRFFEYQDDGLFGLTIEDLIPADIRLKHRAMRRHYQSDPKTRVMQYGAHLQALTAKGHKKLVTIDIAPVTDNDEQFVVSLIRDAEKPMSSRYRSPTPVADAHLSKADHGEDKPPETQESNSPAIALQVFNSDRLDSLTRGKANRVSRVSAALRELIEQADAPIVAALAHAKQGDKDAAKFEVHSMKGAVANYGAEQLASLLANLEKAILAGESYDSLEASCADIQSAVAEFSELAECWISSRQ